MARLPVPGNDDGVWGNVLNDFLSIEHNADGTLKSSGSLNSKADNSAVVHNIGNETVAGVKTFSNAPVVPSSSFPESAVTNLTSDLGARLKYRGAWTASTAYAVNDLVTFSGSSYVVTTAFTSGSKFSLTNLSALASRPGVYNVKEYGAMGDGTTDDTAAIVNTINAAIAAGVANGSNYAEVYFPPAVYLIAGNPTTGGTTFGSAQIPLPIIAQTAAKFVLVLRGTADATALYHWLQTTPQEAGAVLRTTYDAGNATPATGEVSVVGGPTPHFNYGNGSNNWNNMLVTVDGITIEVPQNGNICGFDFRGMAEANVWNASVLARSTVTGAPSIPSPNWSFGLWMPQTNNNDNCNIGYYSCEGLVYGLIITEHVQVNSLRLINCYDGLVVWPSSGFPHRNVIAYASIENCNQCIVFASVGTMKLDILSADIEWGSGYIINDSHNAAYGTIGIGSNGDTGDSLNTALSSGSTGVNGGAHLKIVNLDQSPGVVTAPTVPSSGTALTNPFWRDAAVTITGGTVSNISVGGTTQFTASPATVYVPSGKTVTLTYSVAPTWHWTLL
jgi:hypothetical protein